MQRGAGVRVAAEPGSRLAAVDPEQRTGQLSESLRALGGTTLLWGFVGQFPYVGLLAALLVAHRLLRCARLIDGSGAWWLHLSAVCVVVASVVTAPTSDAEWALAVSVLAFALALFGAARAFGSVAAWFGGFQRWQRCQALATVSLCVTCLYAGWALAGRSGGAPWVVASLALMVAGFLLWLAFSDLRRRVESALTAFHPQEQLHG